VKKRPNNFVMMDRGFLENEALSWKAKGILAYLLSKPDNWKVIIKDLVNHATDGKAAVYNGLAELKAQGHYAKIPVRDESGRRISHWEGTVSEVPMESLDITPSSLLPDFQEIENQELENQDIENRERSNNYYSKFECSNSKPSQVQSERVDRQDTTDATRRIEAYTALIHDNIGYDSFQAARPHDIAMIDEFTAIMLDILMTDGATVRIGGEDKPRELVRRSLLSLGYDDIEHAIDQFKGVTGRVTKKKPYILTLLYNCKLELHSHLTNAVRSNAP